MEEGIFVDWLKRDGEAVRPGDALFTLESEKATEEVESLDGGMLRIPADGPKAGDRVVVGLAIGQLRFRETAIARTPAPPASGARGSG